MQQVALRALQAGKHVLQEKPMANSIIAANDALEKYGSSIRQLNATFQSPVWALAENYRSAISLQLCKSAEPAVSCLTANHVFAIQVRTSISQGMSSGDPTGYNHQGSPLYS